MEDLDNISANSIDDKYHQASRILGGATMDVNQFSQDTSKLEYEENDEQNNTETFEELPI